MLDLNVVVVKRYGYRTAIVHDRFMQFDFKKDDCIDQWSKQLADEAHAWQDNHVCYHLRNTQSGQNLYIQFSDWGCYVGSSIHERDW